MLHISDSLSRYDVTVTVDRDGYLRDPAEFVVVAKQAASSRAARVMSAYTAEKIINTVTVQAADRPAAAAIALAMVSDALTRPIAPPSRESQGHDGDHPSE